MIKIQKATEMKKHIQTLMILSLFGMFMTACNFEFTTAHVSNIQICEQMQGTLCDGDKPVISTNARNIYVSCKLNNAASNTEVTFTWKYMVDKPLTIDEVVLNTEEKGANLDLHSSLSRPNNGWPKGRYVIDIMVDGIKDKIETKEFEIQ